MVYRTFPHDSRNEAISRALIQACSYQ